MNGDYADAAAAAVAPEENEEEEEEKACDELNIQQEEGQEQEEAGLRPKLAEGFYEIEAVRRKRVRKGQVQYFIKWRGWPETANTWEPYENLVSCYDVIEAFEESLLSGKHRSRKRKRRSSGPIPQAKKKPQGNHADTLRAPAAGDVEFNEGNFVIPSLDDQTHDNGGRSRMGDINNDEAMEQGNENGSVVFPPQVEERENQYEMDVNLGEPTDTPFPSEGSNRLPVDILESETSEVICFENGHKMVDGEGVVQAGAFENGHQKVDGEGVFQAGVFENGHQKVDVEGVVKAGGHLRNRKRKPALVKRFSQEQTPCVTNYAAQDLTTKNTRSCGIATQNRDQNSVYRSNDLGCKNKSDNITDTSSITEIMKPISFSSSESVQDILVTFMAKRSDGKEVMVDNKYLKANNPLVLINYYEQHLNYNATTGPHRPGRDNMV